VKTANHVAGIMERLLKRQTNEKGEQRNKRSERKEVQRKTCKQRHKKGKRASQNTVQRSHSEFALFFNWFSPCLNALLSFFISFERWFQATQNCNRQKHSRLKSKLEVARAWYYVTK